MLKLSRLTMVSMALTIVSLTCITLTFGEEKAESSIWESFRETWSPRLDINLRGSYYYKDSTLKPEDGYLSGNAIAQFSRELTSSMMLHVDPRINFDTLYTNGVQLFIEDQEDRPTLTLNEVLLTWYGDSIEMEAGKKIYSWKVADGFSPVDTLNPVDIIEFMDPEKIGIPSISALKMFESVNFQAVWLPFFVPDRQPDDTNRWTSDDPEARAEFIRKFGVEPVNIDSGRALPDNALDKMSIASRLSSSTLLSGWDLAVVYRYGYSTRGVIRNDIDLSLLPLVYQTTEYPAYNLYGLSFSTASGDVEYHGEAAFHDTRDNVKEDDYLSYIAGVNYTNYDWLSHWFEEIRFVVEYAGEEIIKKRAANSTYSDKGVGRGLTSNIIGSIKFKINEDHSFKASFIYNILDTDSVLDMYGESQLNDHLEMIYGYQQLSGDETSFFGQWDNNDRFYVKVAIKY